MEGSVIHSLARGWSVGVCADGRCHVLPINYMTCFRSVSSNLCVIRALLSSGPYGVALLQDHCLDHYFLRYCHHMLLFFVSSAK